MVLSSVASAAVIAAALIASAASAEFVLPDLPPFYDECGRLAETVRQKSSWGKGFESVPYEFVKQCYSAFPADQKFKEEHVKELKPFIEAYPLTDVHLFPAGWPFSFSGTRVDIFKELDRIAANASITTQYDFFSQIHQLITSFEDPYFSYAPMCMMAFDMRQPFRLGAVYSKADVDIWPAIKVLDVSPASAAIDGLSAISAVEDFAAKRSNYARTLSARFNHVLLGKTFSKGQFITRPGLFNEMLFLPSEAGKPRTYVLSPPPLADGTQPEDITLTVPWAAFPRRKMREGISTTNAGYYNVFCEDKPPLPALGRRHVSPTDSKLEENEPQRLIRPSTPAGTSDPPTAPSIKEISDAVLANALRRHHDKSLQKRQDTTVEPIPFITDNNVAFFVLNDGITGVLVFKPVPSQVFTFFMGFVTGGLRALEQIGVKRLIIDVTANDGGDGCSLVALAEYLLQNTTMVEDQFRLKPSVQALLKFGLLNYNNQNRVTNSVEDLVSRAYLQERGYGPMLLSGRFRFCQSEFKTLSAFVNILGLPQLERGWAAEDIAAVSDGGCGSACSRMIRSMRDSHPGFKTYTYGGLGRFTAGGFPPTSSDGGMNIDFFSPIPDIAEDVYRTGDLYEALKPEAFGVLTPEERSAMPSKMNVKIVGGIPTTQVYSPLGPGGVRQVAEWRPQIADGHVTVVNPNDKKSLWEAVAKEMREPGLPPPRTRIPPLSTSTSTSITSSATTASLPSTSQTVASTTSASPSVSSSSTTAVSLPSSSSVTGTTTTATAKPHTEPYNAANPTNVAGLKPGASNSAHAYDADKTFFIPPYVAPSTTAAYGGEAATGSNAPAATAAGKNATNLYVNAAVGVRGWWAAAGAVVAAAAAVLVA
ncbi:hypothetical protein HDU96_009133 [Phlyctochytrium bullatum]|nr:hypothetical protein HDU96_009133 [Phlyctochytrium bullatum]